MCSRERLITSVRKRNAMSQTTRKEGKSRESNKKLSAEFNKSIENFVDEEIWNVGTHKTYKEETESLTNYVKAKIGTKKKKKNARKQTRL